ncbi:MAG: TonB-dependent receptor [Candidatus Kapaibacteriota bacterium]
MTRFTIFSLIAIVCLIRVKIAYAAPAQRQRSCTLQPPDGKSLLTFFSTEIFVTAQVSLRRAASSPSGGFLQRLQAVSVLGVAILLLQGAFLTLSAQQNALVRGKISANNDPVGFATVRLVGTKWGTRSDSAGNFQIANLPEGAYTLDVRRIGFKTISQKIRLEAAQNLTLALTMQEDKRVTEKLVVTGTMRETLISDSPVMVEVYTPTFLKKNPTACLFDALQVVNGVRPQLNCSICNTGDIHINGLEGAYTMVMIDGMPIVSGLSTVYGLTGIPNSLVERIEIVKGPASTLYGSEALAGIINVITKSPTKAATLAFDAFSTSWLEHNLDASAKLKIGALTGLVGVNYFHFQNRVDNNGDGFTDATLQQRLSAFTKWSLEREDKGETSLAVRYVTEDRFGGQMNWSPEFRGGDSIYGESIITNRAEVIGAYQLPIPNEKIILRGSFNHHHQNSYYGTTPFFATQQISFGQITWEKTLWEAHQFLFGAATRHTFYQDNTPATNDANGQPMPQNILLPGVFIQDEIALAPEHTLLLGARYDWSSAHGSIVTPRINYKWKSENDDVVRLSAGNGFRVVNIFTEDHAALTGARRVVIREALKPEMSYNANVNYSKTLALPEAFITLDATAFYTYFTNKIIPDYDTNPDEIIYDNLRGYAVSAGASANVDVAFTDVPLKIMLGATVLDVFNVDDGARTLPVLAERFSGTFAVSYAFKEIGLSFDYTGAVYGPMRLPVFQNDPRPEFSPLFSLQNIQITKTFDEASPEWKSLEIYAGVKNLLNYTPPANSIMRPFDPFDKRINDPLNNPNNFTFDPTYVYASFQGIRGFLGVRWRLD